MNLPERSYLIIDKKYPFDYEKYKENNNVIETKKTYIIFGNKINVKMFLKDDVYRVFFGDYIDPIHYRLNNEEVINQINKGKDFLSLINNTYSIFGKWFIFQEDIEEIKIFGDPHVTKSIKYHQEKLVISDIASIISNITKEKSIIENNVSALNFYNQFYKKTKWWPGDATYYENILSLLPNHILKIHDGDFCASRYIYSPKKKLINQKDYIDYCYDRSKELLSGYFKALSNRKEFALTLTAGKDSRLLFSASHSQKLSNSNYFVTQSTEMTGFEDDILIPINLCNELNVKFNVFKIKNINRKTDACNIINEYFPDAPVESYYRHIFEEFYDNKNMYFIYGLIPETFSKYYVDRFINVRADSLCDIARCPKNIFAKNEYNKWLDKVNYNDLPIGYDILDLFYWEHRGGRWGNQYLNILDLFQEGIWGFNCREFYDIWMTTPNVLRKNPDRNNIKNLTRLFGSEYISQDYERPKNFITKIRTKIENIRIFYYILRKVNYTYVRIKTKKS
jgi:hypothetical protein